jgi:hypothetical protein
MYANPNLARPLFNHFQEIRPRFRVSFPSRTISSNRIMSTSNTLVLDHLFGVPLPTTTRGQSTKLGISNDGILSYASNRSAILRSLDGSSPSLSFSSPQIVTVAKVNAAGTALAVGDSVGNLKVCSIPALPNTLVRLSEVDAALIIYVDRCLTSLEMKCGLNWKSNWEGRFEISLGMLKANGFRW